MWPIDRCKYFEAKFSLQDKDMHFQMRKATECIALSYKKMKMTKKRTRCFYKFGCLGFDKSLAICPVNRQDHLK